MSKRIGDIAESIFVTRCLMANIEPVKPFGDNRKYDFITEHNGKKLKVQVKCTDVVGKNPSGSSRFKINTCYGSKSKTKYTKDEIDFIAAFVFPEQMWYIIPVEEVTESSVTLYPQIENSDGKYEKFRNKFKLLKGAEEVVDESNEDMVKNFELI